MSDWEDASMRHQAVVLAPHYRSRLLGRSRRGCLSAAAYLAAPDTVFS